MSGFEIDAAAIREAAKALVPDEAAWEGREESLIDDASECVRAYLDAAGFREEEHRGSDGGGGQSADGSPSPSWLQSRWTRLAGPWKQDERVAEIRRAAMAPVRRGTT